MNRYAIALGLSVGSTLLAYGVFKWLQQPSHIITDITHNNSCHSNEFTKETKNRASRRDVNNNNTDTEHDGYASEEVGVCNDLFSSTKWCVTRKQLTQTPDEQAPVEESIAPKLVVASETSAVAATNCGDYNNKIAMSEGTAAAAYSRRRDDVDNQQADDGFFSINSSLNALEEAAPRPLPPPPRHISPLDFQMTTLESLGAEILTPEDAEVIVSVLRGDAAARETHIVRALHLLTDSLAFEHNHSVVLESACVNEVASLCERTFDEHDSEQSAVFTNVVSVAFRLCDFEMFFDDLQNSTSIFLRILTSDSGRANSSGSDVPAMCAAIVETLSRRAAAQNEIVFHVAGMYAIVAEPSAAIKDNNTVQLVVLRALCNATTSRQNIEALLRLPGPDNLSKMLAENGPLAGEAGLLELWARYLCAILQYLHDDCGAVLTPQPADTSMFNQLQKDRLRIKLTVFSLTLKTKDTEAKKEFDKLFRYLQKPILLP